VPEAGSGDDGSGEAAPPPARGGQTDMMWSATILLALAKTPAQTQIEHVVLLLMENRPFDMFYGFAQPYLTNTIDGLTGKECFPTRSFRKGETPHWKQAEDIEFDDDDGDDDDDDDDDDDEIKAANIPTWGLDPSHPLDGKTQIMYNTFKTSGKAEDKYVSFAYSALPPGETNNTLHWLRATYTSVKDAMPTKFEAVTGAPNVYKLKNTWPGYEGYLCEGEQSGHSYQFLRTSCSASDALQFMVTPTASGSGEYVLQTSVGKKYVSFCNGACAGGRWLAASYASRADAMTLLLSDPGVAPPPPPPGPPGCVESGGANFICHAGGPYLGKPPLGYNSSWDGFNPMCPRGLPTLCPGGVCPALCTNGLGNVARHVPCKWPLTYEGTTYDGTTGGIGTGTGGYGFCSPYGGEYNGSFGGVKPCGSDSNNTASGFWAGCTQFPPTNHGGWLMDGPPEGVHQFSPEQVPIHLKLAQEFALFDQYHTSFPGPSTPNHLYLMSGTNAGCTSTGQDYQCKAGRKYPQKTIFESLQENGHEWRYYYNDSSSASHPLTRTLSLSPSHHTSHPPTHPLWGSSCHMHAGGTISPSGSRRPRASPASRGTTSSTTAPAKGRCPPSHGSCPARARIRRPATGPTMTILATTSDSVRG
jgi:hypothetical protein